MKIQSNKNYLKDTKQKSIKIKTGMKIEAKLNMKNVIFKIFLICLT